MYLALSRRPDGVAVVEVQPNGDARLQQIVPDKELAAFVRAQQDDVRWVWDSTARWYPQLLEAGVRVWRCVDLALTRAILRGSALTADTDYARAADDAEWDALTTQAPEEVTLFTLDEPGATGSPDPAAELARQLAAVEGSTAPDRLRLLLAAESAGALIACELHFAGLPWSAEAHDKLLTELLGARPARGARPAKLEALAQRVRAALGAPALNPDSPGELLHALQRAGVPARSTRARELRESGHPAIAPLLEYKKLSRLAAANGWAWMDAWASGGRFHADYVPGAVVSGRWATHGGGALQLPKQIRGAVIADPGWTLVVADAAQLEPRVLSGLSHDRAMATAGRGHDLYDGVVASGVIDTRAHAKVAMLGALYGATTGDSARLAPRLARAFPAAIAYVDRAARLGERGEIVTSRLGRSSPRPPAAWDAAQAQASQQDARPADERRARAQARDWGRFRRNFVVQSTAAEWALCWMAQLRASLAGIQTASRGEAPAPFDQNPHLVFFLHDEIIVHTPEDCSERVVELVREAARDAGRRLFGAFPVEFPLSVAVVRDYGQAK